MLWPLVSLLIHHSFQFSLFRKPKGPKSGPWWLSFFERFFQALELSLWQIKATHTLKEAKWHRGSPMTHHWHSFKAGFFEQIWSNEVVISSAQASNTKEKSTGQHFLWTCSAFFMPSISSRQSDLVQTGRGFLRRQVYSSCSGLGTPLPFIKCQIAGNEGFEKVGLHGLHRA